MAVADRALEAVVAHFVRGAAVGQAPVRSATALVVDAYVDTARVTVIAIVVVLAALCEWKLGVRAFHVDASIDGTDEIVVAVGIGHATSGNGLQEAITAVTVRFEAWHIHPWAAN
jgi:hypothetical protein